MKKKWIPAICIYIALLIVCLIVVYAVPSVKGLLEKTYIAEYGSLDITNEVSGFVVRDEIVYVAAQDCTINRLVEENSLVKADTRVVEVTIDETDEASTEDEAEDETVDVSYKYRDVVQSLGEDVKSTKSGKAKVAGYVVYSVDGAEAKLSTDKLDDLRKSDYEELTNLKNVATTSKTCRKGEPVFKIVRNHEWYMVFYTDKDSAERYVEGRSLQASIAGQSVPVTVDSVVMGESLAKVTFSCKTFFNGFLGTRSLKAQVTLASAQGLILKDESIVTNSDGQIGVFIKNKLGQHKFRPIALKADDGENCVAYSDLYVDADGNFVETIKTYDEIVVEPTAEDLESIGVNVEEGTEGSEEDSGSN